jgi:Lectin C-type domain
LIAAFNEPPSTRMMVKVYFLSTIFRAEWMEAFNFCKSNGMELANFRNRNEIDHFLDLLRRHGNFPANERIYIDGIGNIPGNRGPWHSFETGKLMDFNLPWLPREPNNLGGREYCMEINYEGHILALNDFVCDIKLCFVCQEIGFI